ncbi:PEP-utilizing enzyme, partial [Paraburkholderia sp. SIMBA_009]
LEDGAVTSHVVIVARAMGIPIIGQATGIVALAENNDPIIIDGDDGQVHLRPMSDLQRAYEEKVRLRAKRQEQFRALRNVEPITKDGQ